MRRRPCWRGPTRGMTRPTSSVPAGNAGCISSSSTTCAGRARSSCWTASATTRRPNPAGPARPSAAASAASWRRPAWWASMASSPWRRWSRRAWRTGRGCCCPGSSWTAGGRTCHAPSGSARRRTMTTAPASSSTAS